MLIDLSKIPAYYRKKCFGSIEQDEYCFHKETAVHSDYAHKPNITTFDELIAFLKANLKPIKSYSYITLECIRIDIDKRLGYVLKPVLAAALIEAGFKIHEHTGEVNCSTKSKLFKDA